MTSARRDLKGSIPFHDEAEAGPARVNRVNANTQDIATARAFSEILMAEMLMQPHDFAKGRTRSRASLKSASSGATLSAFS